MLCNWNGLFWVVQNGILAPCTTHFSEITLYNIETKLGITRIISGNFHLATVYKMTSQILATC